MQASKIPSMEQMLNLTERAERKGGLTAAEAERLATGIQSYAHGTGPGAVTEGQRQETIRQVRKQLKNRETELLRAREELRAEQARLRIVRQLLQDAIDARMGSVPVSSLANVLRKK